MSFLKDTWAYSPNTNHLGVAGDWELCHTSLANFTQAAEDMVECKEVSTSWKKFFTSYFTLTKF